MMSESTQDPQSSSVKFQISKHNSPEGNSTIINLLGWESNLQEEDQFRSPVPQTVHLFGLLEVLYSTFTKLGIILNPKPWT